MCAIYIYFTDTGTLATTTTTSSPTTTNSQKSAFTASRCHSFDNTFTCDNGKCILDNERCDGTNDCGDSSDEDGCGGKAVLHWSH